VQRAVSEHEIVVLGGKNPALVVDDKVQCIVPHLQVQALVTAAHGGDVRLGMTCRKLRDGLREFASEIRAVVPEAQGGPQRRIDAARLGDELLEQGGEKEAAPVKVRARGRQAERAVVPGKQGNAHLVLEFFHLLGDCRLRHVALCGRVLKIAALDDGLEILDSSEHRANPSDQVFMEYRLENLIKT
jgi:hypothetical protein